MQEKDRQSVCTGKRMTIILTISLLALVAAGIVLWNVFAAESAYKSGSMEIRLDGTNMPFFSPEDKNPGMQAAVGKLTLSRTSAPTIEELRTKSTKWNVNLKVTDGMGSTMNRYNLRIGKYVNGEFTTVTQVSTGKDANQGYYYIFNIPVTFTIPAHSQITGQSVTKNCPDGRCLYYTDAAGTKKLVKKTCVDEATTVTVYLQVNAAQTGIKTYAGTRYEGATAMVTLERPKYQVTFRAPGNTNWRTEEIKKELSRGEAVSKPQEPKKTGYRFEGWDRSEEELGCVKSDLSVNAVWKPEEFSYQFHANGGSGTMDIFRLDYLDAGKLPANQYVRSGYLFLGWSKEKRGKVTYKDEEMMHADNPEECKYNLYAVWKKRRTNFYLTEVTEDTDMFSGDGKLIGGNGTKYQEYFTDSSYAHTDQEDDPGYFTGKE